MSDEEAPEAPLDLSTTPQDLTAQRPSRREEPLCLAICQPQTVETNWYESTEVDLLHRKFYGPIEKEKREFLESLKKPLMGRPPIKFEPADQLSVRVPSLASFLSSRLSYNDSRLPTENVHRQVVRPWNLSPLVPRPSLFSGNIPPHASRYEEARQFPATGYEQALSLPPAASRPMPSKTRPVEVRSMVPFKATENANDHASFWNSKTHTRNAPSPIFAPSQSKEIIRFSVEAILSWPQRTASLPKDVMNPIPPSGSLSCEGELAQPSSNVNGIKSLCALADSRPAEPLNHAEVARLSTSSKDSGIVEDCDGSAILELPPELVAMIEGTDISLFTPLDISILKEKFQIYLLSKKNTSYLPRMLDADDYKDFQVYREIYKYQRPLQTKTNINMRRNVPSKSPYSRDPNYLEKRKKNNEAAKRSRDARKLAEYELCIFEEFLYRRNAKLKMQLNITLDAQEAVLVTVTENRWGNRGADNKIVLEKDFIGIDPKIIPNFAYTKLPQSDIRAFNNGLQAYLQSQNE